jgi:RNA polymerase sigma-70 factor (ECF subfamily)
VKKKAQKVKDMGDSELIKLIRKDNPELYREVVKRYQKKLFSYIYRLVNNKEETEDILQNVFVKTYISLKSFDLEKKFSSWIYRIAHNEAINFLKKRNKRRLISWEDIASTKDKMETKSEELDPLDVWLKKETRIEVRGALEKLPENYQQVLILRYFSDKSYAEIGKIIKSPANTVGTLINRAKKKLMDVVCHAQGLD